MHIYNSSTAAVAVGSGGWEANPWSWMNELQVQWRDPISKYNVERNRGRHLTQSPGFPMYVHTQKIHMSYLLVFWVRVEPKRQRHHTEGLQIIKTSRGDKKWNPEQPAMLGWNWAGSPQTLRSWNPVTLGICSTFSRSQFPHLESKREKWGG